jgi:hypothetical protein
MEALTVWNAERLEGAELGGGFDSFGDDGCADLAGEGDEGRGERSAHRVGVDAAGDGDVEFDDVGLQAEDVSEAGEAGAGVVDGQADASGS